jgi:hypothetical protein
MLAIPLHLFADRGLLGNTLKPFSIPFEPQPLPAFTAFMAQVTGKPQPRSPRPSSVQVEPADAFQRPHAEVLSA